jgi:hypothetical protein
VTARELDEEVEKAKEFKPRLHVFYLVSTAPDDQPLQERARLITERHQAMGLFTVAVIGWRELVRRATRHQHVAAKHFGTYSQGPASPLLATWRAAAGKLLLDDRELGIAIQELIHDLRDYPGGRFVFRQKESEDLLFQIKLQDVPGQSLDQREALLKLRDRLKIQRDRESAVVTGLMLLCGHASLRDMVRVVWERDAPLLIRSFVEQRIDPNLGVVTGLEKIRLRPPGSLDYSLALFLEGADIETIWKHQATQKKRFPMLATDNISELPNDVQFRLAVPAVIRKIVWEMEEGISLTEIERRNWLDMSVWKFTC